jgi:hypothetical protein
MVVMLIVLVGLGTIAGLTVISMQSSQATTSNTQFNAIAVYAAESGAVAAIDFLRKNTQPTPAFLGAFVRANNVNVLPEAGIPGNDIPSGGVGNLLSLDRRSSYTVLIFNNRADTGLGPGQDTDGIVVLHVTGRGPNGAIAELEWEVKTDGDVTHPLTILSSRQAL